MNTFDPRTTEQYWNEWNRDWRFRDKFDGFMQRQLDTAIEVARNARLQDARILGVGCGTGWLEYGLLQFGEVWGTDLSPEAIAEGTHRHPGVRLKCCDFLRETLPGPFDLIVSTDSLSPMADYALCIKRVAELLAPGGTFLLMTQNPFVWTRRSAIRQMPKEVPNSEPQRWPTRHAVHRLLAPCFDIRRVFTFDPGGDLGLLWWVENRGVQSLMQRIVGEYRWRRLLEVAGLGRELVFVATRK